MKIAIGIPCLNEKPYIEECIHAIYANQFTDDIELSVAVIDGMSDDGTREVVARLMLQYPTLKLLNNTTRFTPYAFNIGITAQEADYYQIVGARHILSENYLQTALTILQNDTSIWCVGGRTINQYVNHTGEVIASAMSTSFGMGLGNFRTLSKSGFTDTVTSPMYPAWVFQKIGYFDENLVRNQDDDFNFRVTKAGGKIYYEHNISLKYYVRGDYGKLYRQFFQYGYWKVYVNKKHKTVTTLRQLVPPIFVVYLFLFLWTAFFGVYVGLLGVFPLLVYLFLGLYVANNLIKENPKLDLWDVFKTFPILHVSYGLGYLKGMLHFLLLNKQPSSKEKKTSR